MELFSSKSSSREKSSLELRSSLREFQLVFNSFLSTSVIPFISSAAVPQLAQAMVYALQTPGKRLRPILLLYCAGAELDPQKDLRAFYAATAMELIHSYSLIHDDLPAMDNDSLRRGRPTCHVEFSEWAAILAGDALHSLSFEFLLKAVQDSKEQEPSLLEKVILSLSKGCGMEGMISGQALDLALEKETKKKHSYSMEEKKDLVLAIHRKKTGALFRSCCEIGALLSNSMELSAYQEYGEKLGLLFQIKDDLLDIEGDPKRMGKAARKDINKLSYPAVFGLEEAKLECRKLLGDLQELSSRLCPDPRGRQDHREYLRALPLYIFEREA